MGQASSVDLELASFCEDEHRRLVGLLALYVGQRSTAEELAQDAFARLCEHWPRVRNMANRRAWLKPPGQDDRPSQPAAFLDLHNVLPILHQPTDRIRALELIRSMDTKWLEFRPHEQDLLGRPGVGIVGIDPVDDARHVIVFDPDTGNVLGTIDETPQNGRPAVTGMSAITKREILER